MLSWCRQAHLYLYPRVFAGKWTNTKPLKYFTTRDFPFSSFHYFNHFLLDLKYSFGVCWIYMENNSILHNGMEIYEVKYNLTFCVVIRDVNILIAKWADLGLEMINLIRVFYLKLLSFCKWRYVIASAGFFYSHTIFLVLHQ